MAQRKFPDWATSDISDIGNGDPNKADPGSAKQAIGWVIEKPLLQHMNWLQNLFGHFIRANNQFKHVISGYEAEAGERLIVDNTTSIATLFLPSSPLEGQWVEVEGAELYSTFEVIVDGNGIDIMEIGESNSVLDLDNVIFKFTYDLDTNLWVIKVTGQTGRIN